MMSDWEDVEPARPEPKTKTLIVTSSHISLARDRSDLFGDPVSRAMKEELKADWCMSGWGYTNCGFPNNIRRSYTLWPHKELQLFFRRWQAGKTVEPIKINYILDREYDKTPKPSKRKPVQNKSWLQLQTELKL